MLLFPGRQDVATAPIAGVVVIDSDDNYGNGYVAKVELSVPAMNNDGFYGNSQAQADYWPSVANLTLSSSGYYSCDFWTSTYNLP
jgi:hypothetical protein